MNLIPLYSKVYDARNYNCAHFVCDAWEAVTGDDTMRPALAAVLLPRSDRTALPLHGRLRRLGGPISPCLAVFSSKGSSVHVGIYLAGRILHLTKQGVHCADLQIVMSHHQKVEFYKCKQSIS